MRNRLPTWLSPTFVVAVLVLLAAAATVSSQAATHGPAPPAPRKLLNSRLAPDATNPMSSSPQYVQLQHRLAQGWNTWDVQSVTSHVLLPDGLAIHVGLEHNTTELVDSFLSNPLIGRLARGAEQVTPGPHAWDGSYTDLRITWRHSSLRIQSAHDGDGLVILATPLDEAPNTSLPPTLVFSVDYLWNRRGTVTRMPASIEARSASHTVEIYCASSSKEKAGAIVASGAPCSIDKDVEHSGERAVFCRGLPRASRFECG